jgi:hypothetical protein
MYDVIDRARWSETKVTHLTAEERNDLRLIHHLVSVVKWGISLNNIIRRMPDHIG